MPESFPAPVYAETVLAHNFADAKRYFLDALLEIHFAHTRMLAKQGILTRQDEGTLLEALRGLDLGRIQAADYDGSHEDLFFFVESLLEEAAGEIAGKMHIARSRNDIAITLYRMAVRHEILELFEDVWRTRMTLLDLAAKHRETVMPAHTHTQPAQPTTLAHYLLGVSEFLGRDLERLQAAYTRVNRSPMGAAAITTTGFPIDRDETARLLGFDGLVENSYGAIASIDYLTETAAAIAVAMVNLGKLVQDLLLWSTREFGFLRLSDGFVQSSSIMPQKRNPVALEHTRILASRALGEAQTVLTCAHNTPFGDINDSEDDLQPLVFTAFADARRAVRLLAGVMQSAEVDTGKLAERAGGDFLTVTELADTLVREAGLSFREAHGWVAEAVKLGGPQESAEQLVRRLRAAHPSLRVSEQTLAQALDPRHFVHIRDRIGGPAPVRTGEAIEQHRESQRAWKQWIAERRESLERARVQVRA